MYLCAWLSSGFLLYVSWPIDDTGQFFLVLNHLRMQALWKTCPQGVEVRVSPGVRSFRHVEHWIPILLPPDSTNPIRNYWLTCESGGLLT